MHGNVWELCGYISDYSRLAPLDNSTNVNVGDLGRTFRGGSWDDGDYYLRSAMRGHNSHGFRGSGMGFRVAVCAK